MYYSLSISAITPLGLSSMPDQPKRILVLYRLHYPLHKLRLSSLQQLQALEKSSSSYEIVYFNAVFGVPSWFKNLDFDVIILSTLFLGMRWFPRYFQQWKQTMKWIAEFDCLKIAIPQDEYDHAHTLDDWLYDWNVQIIFSNFDDTYRETLYPKMHQKAEFHHCYTGYINQDTVDENSLKPISQRPLDIVYRARHLPYWFGGYGQFKHTIAEKVTDYAPEHGLNIDISTNTDDTITGSEWIQFMASSRATIGCESGVSALDPRGEIKSSIMQWQQQEPNLSFENASKRLPVGWDDYEFLAIGPRHFEAVMTKTCQILIRGDYSGVLEADKHYIPVEHDFSNLDAVLQKLKDDTYIQQMVDTAYNDIACNDAYTYEAFAEQLDTVIQHHTQDNTYQEKPRLGWQISIPSRVADTTIHIIDFGIRTFGVRKVISKLMSGA